MTARNTIPVVAREAQQLAREGESEREIAAKLGVGRERVRRELGRKGKGRGPLILPMRPMRELLREACGLLAGYGIEMEPELDRWWAREKRRVARKREEPSETGLIAEVIANAEEAECEGGERDGSEAAGTGSGDADTGAGCDF